MNNPAASGRGIKIVLRPKGLGIKPELRNKKYASISYSVYDYCRCPPAGSGKPGPGLCSCCPPVHHLRPKNRPVDQFRYRLRNFNSYRLLTARNRPDRLPVHCPVQCHENNRCPVSYLSRHKSNSGKTDEQRRNLHSGESKKPADNPAGHAHGFLHQRP